MTDKTETTNPTIDKTAWGPGPWQTEPDKITWVDETSDLDCMAHRNRLGAWCGYVGVTRASRHYGRSYEDVDRGVEVHGGLTYSSACRGDLCHVPYPGRDGDVWWLGFDCGHGYDVVPGLASTLAETDIDAPLEFPGSSYKELGYVVAETIRLAAQLAREVDGEGRESREE